MHIAFSCRLILTILFALIWQFRERVKDLLTDDLIKDDYYLLRWIRGNYIVHYFLCYLHKIYYFSCISARDSDLDKAEKMLKTVYLISKHAF